MAQPEKVALIDMDGTLVDYSSQMQADLAKMMAPGDEPISVEQAWTEGAPAHIKARMDLVKCQPGWWLNLPDLELGHHVLRWCREIGFDLHVLTKGPYKTTSAWSEKVEWCRNRFGHDVKVTITEDKGLMYGRVLVDDFPDYMLRWLEWRPRGLGIMPKNSLNADFTHPRVILYDGFNVDEVQAALRAAFDRESGPV